MQQLRILMERSLEMMQLLTILGMVWEDLRTQTITERQVRILLILCILEGVCLGDHRWIGLSAGIPGLLMAICGYLWSDGLGDGDILVVSALGFTLDLQKVLRISTDAIFLAGGIGLCLLLLGECERKERIPWMPCVGAAALYQMMFN